MGINTLHKGDDDDDDDDDNNNNNIRRYGLINFCGSSEHNPLYSRMDIEKRVQPRSPVINTTKCLVV